MGSIFKEKWYSMTLSAVYKNTGGTPVTTGTIGETLDLVWLSVEQNKLLIN